MIDKQETQIPSKAKMTSLNWLRPTYVEMCAIETNPLYKPHGGIMAKCVTRTPHNERGSTISLAKAHYMNNLSEVHGATKTYSSTCFQYGTPLRV